MTDLRKAKPGKERQHVTPNDSLTAKQQRAIASLVAGKTVLEAASDCHASEAAIYRWKREQAFKTALHEAKSDVLEQSLTRLIRYSNAAIDCLARNMVNDNGASAAIRGVQVRAAQALLDANINVHRMHELEGEVEALRQQMSEAESESENPEWLQ